MWELQEELCIHVFEFHTKAINSITVTPDDAKLFVGSDDKLVTMWYITSIIEEHEAHDDMIGVKEPEVDDGIVVNESIKTMEGHEKNIPRLMGGMLFRATARE